MGEPTARRCDRPNRKEGEGIRQPVGTLSRPGRNTVDAPGQRWTGLRVSRPNSCTGSHREICHVHVTQWHTTLYDFIHLYQIEWRENGRRLTRSLKHRDWTRAKRQADEAAADFAMLQPNGKAEAAPEALTLERLFEIYGEEVVPTKHRRTQYQNRATMRMFLDFLGRDRRPETLSRRDWDRFIRERRAGRVGPSGKPVSDNTIAFNLKILVAILNWAAKSRDEQGRLLLDSNPLRGLGGPKVKNPTRIVLSDEEYEALLKVSRQVGWRFHVALVLAHETGHRIGAIRKLRWSDIRFEDRTILWRGEHEKTGYEHRMPATDEAITALEEARRHAHGAGDALVLPAARNPSRWVSRSRVSTWWYTAERRAGLEPKRGRSDEVLVA